MRITRLQVEDPSGQPTRTFATLSPGLNIVPLQAEERGDAVIDLLHTVLFGQRSRDDYQQLCGSLDAEASLGRYRLKRSLADGAPRFTIANLDGKATPAGAVERLLQDLPVRVAERVFHANGRRGDQLGDLLSQEVAQAFQDLDLRRGSARTETSGQRPAAPYGSQSQLLDRRDELARLIEDRLAERRDRSGRADREVRELDADTEKLRQRRETVDRRRMKVEAELSAIETRLRYEAISDAVNRETDRRDISALTPQLDELEQQIERWRTTLADLELRESHVRSELATIHPDDASPTIGLTDQRAGLTVAARLLGDLESEVARLARAADSNACVCRDAHPRINPLVETLTRQISRLSDLADQQELAYQAQQLKAEAEHLARSQADIQKQIEHLLGRRQELWRTTRAKRDESLDVPHESGEACLRPRAELETELAQLQAELSEIDASLERHELKRRELIDLRSNLLTSSEFDSLRHELDDVERQLRQEPLRSFGASRIDRSNPWRASELFSRMTDGEWVGLRLVRRGRELAATDRYGKQVPARELPSAERRLAAMALRLSMACGAAECGAVLPLVLDDPFAGIDARQASTLATVLEDFGRSGRQVFVCTGDEAALDRFHSLGANTLIGVAEQHEREFIVEQVTAPSTPRAVTRTVRTETTTRRPDYLLSPEDPIEKFPVPIRDRQTVFARSRIRTIADLLGADPSAVAEELDRDDVTAELVALWQTHLAYVCFVPDCTFEDAIIFTEAGYFSPSDLAEADKADFIHRVSTYLRSERGRRFADQGSRFQSDRAGRWIEGARRGRERWRDSDAWRGWSRHRGERSQRVERNGERRRKSETSSTLRIRSERTDHESQPKTNKKPKSKPLRFYLETSSPVVDAPSIGPKTAAKLERIGVRSVQDLFDCDPEAIAEKIDSNRITAETIVAWQHQAELVCRIPELRGHDAQILVECGFTRPEEISSMKPAELFGFVEPFCETTEAQRLLRNAKAPDLAEVSDWINWSRQCRVLGAA